MVFVKDKCRPTLRKLGFHFNIYFARVASRKARVSFESFILRVGIYIHLHFPTWP